MEEVLSMLTALIELSPCPDTPNCVSSQDPDPKRRLPAVMVSGASAEAMAAVRGLLLELKRIRIVNQTDTYLHAEIRSPVFRFVDDIEFLIEADSRLQFRSAARVGKWDLGVNRRRMVRIREALLNRHGDLFTDAQ